MSAQEKSADELGEILWDIASACITCGMKFPFIAVAASRDGGVLALRFADQFLKPTVIADNGADRFPLPIDVMVLGQPDSVRHVVIETAGARYRSPE